MKQVRVQSLGLDQASKTPVVILQEIDGERVLPIWIGPAEASAIAMELAGMKFARPLTHDLAASLVRQLGGSLTSVTITRVEGNTYYAELAVERNGEQIMVDARPSDSIAIALRLKADIFTTDDLLATSTVELTDQETALDLAEPGGAAEEEAGEGKSLSAEELQEYIRKLNPEDLGRFQP